MATKSVWEIIGNQLKSVDFILFTTTTSEIMILMQFNMKTMVAIVNKVYCLKCSFPKTQE